MAANATTPKIKWRVNQYQQWHGRDWPDADYADGSTAASISCEDDYYPPKVKTGNHKPLTINFADHSTTPWRWRRLTKQAATLAEAKALFAAFLAKNHERIAPKAAPQVEAIEATATAEAATECATGGMDADVKMAEQTITETKPRRTRDNTKRAMVIAMLKRPEGATNQQIIDVTGWNATTVRGFLSLAKKKGTNISIKHLPGSSATYFSS